jgi:hypothetical protein
LLIGPLAANRPRRPRPGLTEIIGVGKRAAICGGGERSVVGASRVTVAGRAEDDEAKFAIPPIQAYFRGKTTHNESASAIVGSVCRSAW